MAERTEKENRNKAFLTPEDIERNLNILYERVERLEKLAERVYGELELLNQYIPKIADVLIDYFPAMSKYRREIDTIMQVQKGFIQRLQNNLIDHQINRDIHYSDKKKRGYKYDT